MQTAVRWSRSSNEASVMANHGLAVGRDEQENDEHHIASFRAYGPVPVSPTMQQYTGRPYETMSLAAVNDLLRLPVISVTDVLDQPLLWLYNSIIYTEEPATREVVPAYRTIGQAALWFDDMGVAHRVTGLSDNVVVQGSRLTTMHGLTASVGANGRLSPAVFTAEKYAAVVLGRYPTYFANGVAPIGVDDRVLPYLEDFEAVRDVLQNDLKYVPDCRLAILHPVWHRASSGESPVAPFGQARQWIGPKNGEETGGGHWLTLDQLAWYVGLDYNVNPGGEPEWSGTGHILLDPVDLCVNGVSYCLYEFLHQDDTAATRHFGGRVLRPTFLNYAASIGSAALRYHGGYKRAEKPQASRLHRTMRPLRTTDTVKPLAGKHLQLFKWSFLTDPGVFDWLRKVLDGTISLKYAAKKRVHKSTTDFSLSCTRLGRPVYAGVRNTKLGVNSAWSVVPPTDWLLTLAPEEACELEHITGRGTNTFIGYCDEVGHFNIPSVRDAGMPLKLRVSFLESAVRVGLLPVKALAPRVLSAIVNRARQEAISLNEQKEEEV